MSDHRRPPSPRPFPMLFAVSDERSQALSAFAGCRTMTRQGEANEAIRLNSAPPGLESP